MLRQNEKHCMIRRMRSERMNELSDHKPKKVVILRGEEEVESGEW